MRKSMSLKIGLLVASLFLFLCLAYKYLHGVQKTPFIKPPAVKLIPSAVSLQRFNTLAQSAKAKLAHILDDNEALKPISMNPGVTLFFPSAVSMSPKSAAIVADIVKEVLSEVKNRHIDIYPEEIEWFGRDKQHILVVRHKPVAILQELHDRIEKKAKERGLIASDYQSPPYKPHSSLVGISSGNQEQVILEDKALLEWQKISDVYRQEKQRIVNELAQMLDGNQFSFDKIIIYGSDFKPKFEFDLAGER